MKYVAKIFLVCMTMLLCGCGSSAIDTVTNGTLDLDKTITVGKAFDSYKYFTGKSWKTFESAEGRTLVEFSANIDMQKVCKEFSDKEEQRIAMGWYDSISSDKAVRDSAKINVQFALTTDKKGFQLRSVELGFGDGVVVKRLDVVRDVYSGKPLDVVVTGNKSYVAFAKMQHEKIREQRFHALAETGLKKIEKAVPGVYGVLENGLFCLRINEINSKEVRLDVYEHYNNWMKEDVKLPLTIKPGDHQGVSYGCSGVIKVATEKCQKRNVEISIEISINGDGDITGEYFLVDRHVYDLKVARRSDNVSGCGRYISEVKGKVESCSGQ